MCVLYQFGINTVLYFSVLYCKHISYLNRFEVLKIFMIFSLFLFPSRADEHGLIQHYTKRYCT